MSSNELPSALMCPEAASLERYTKSILTIVNKLFGPICTITSLIRISAPAVADAMLKQFVIAKPPICMHIQNHMCTWAKMNGGQSDIFSREAAHVQLLICSLLKQNEEQLHLSRENRFKN